jgi:TolB-like protein
MSAETSQAVFLSYASQDAEAARRICEALRAAGVEVWFDQNELRGGDAWDAKIKKQIRDCALFVPIISAHTEARLEGYFRLEWHLAEQRSLLMAKGKPYLVPVVIDGTRDRDARVPDAFLAVQWTHLADPAALPSFAAQVQWLLTPGAAQGSRSASTSPSATGASLDSRQGISARTPWIPDYDLLRPIGQGGYGEVWLARGVTGVFRAVKIVWRERFREVEPYEREFRGLKEAMALSTTEAGGLGLLHVGRNDLAGFFYTVMELADDAVTGRSIDPTRYVPLTLKELRQRRGRLPPAECLSLGVAIARALAGLHARGLVHRDIKPANIILVNGVPKLADVGLISIVAEANTFVGTEGYLPPEGPGAPAADVFALGKVLYELVTGLDRHDYPRLPDPLDATTDRRPLFAFNRIVLRACETDVAKRYPDAAAILADLEALQAGKEIGRPAPWRSAVLTALGLAAAAALALTWFFWRGSAPSPMPAPTVSVATPPSGPTAPAKIESPAPDPLVPPSAVAAAAKRLLVLPLESRSSDPETQFLATNLADDIINALLRLPEMPVISAITARSIATEKISLPEMGRRLGVASILNGRVQKSGNLVRISLDLWRAADEVPLWTNTYTRELKDGFALSDEVAAEVAAILQAREVRGSWAGARFTTRNPEAYALFARARNLHVEKGPGLETFREQIRLFEEALKIDPDFMFAANALSIAYSYAFSSARGLEGDQRRKFRDQYKAEAKRWAERSSQLVPGGAGDGALAVYYSMVERDAGQAIVYAQNEVKALPNDANGHNRVANSLIGFGRVQEAVESFNRALALDPLNGRMVHNIPGTYLRLRRPAEFEVAKNRSLAVHGRALSPNNYAWAEYQLTGKLPKQFAERDPVGFRAYFLFASRKWADLLTLVDAQLAGPKVSTQVRVSSQLWRARALQGLRQTDAAHAAAREVLSGSEEVAPSPGEPRGEYEKLRVAALQMAGRREEAIAQARLLVAGARAPSQVAARWEYELNLAEVLAWFGEVSESVSLLGRLLQVPSGLTVPFLEVDPAWDNLRDDPGFKALLADPKNKAPL